MRYYHHDKQREYSGGMLLEDFISQNQDVLDLVYNETHPDKVKENPNGGYMDTVHYNDWEKQYAIDTMLALYPVRLEDNL